MLYIDKIRNFFLLICHTIKPNTQNRMSKTSKTTVKYYLNTKLKPEIREKEETYPIYVRVTHERKNLRFRSVICWKYYTEKELLNNSIQEQIQNETEIINFITNKVLGDDNKIDLVENLDFLAKEIKYFTNILFFGKEIKDSLVDFISKKTKISRKLLDEILNLSYVDILKVVKELDSNIFEDINIKNNFIFYKLFVSFLENHNNSLSVYEWKFKGAKSEFIEYLNKENSYLNFLEKITEIDNMIDITEKYTNQS